jgi:hypothetical protein
VRALDLIPALISAGACPESIAWLRGLDEQTTVALAWAGARDEWRAWLRDEARRDSALLAVVQDLPGFHRRERAKPQRRTGAHETKAFFARLAGHRRLTVLVCADCDGRGCRACEHKGKMKAEPLHPADEWTLRALGVPL